MKKTYSSLTQFKDELEKKGKEKIISFNGAFLITKEGKNNWIYGLYKGEVSRKLEVKD
jgi:hydroxymethylpyrimidine pyrophosphatase-like HAD family hydrolase